MGRFLFYFILSLGLKKGKQGMEMKLKGYVADAISSLYGMRLSEDMVQIQETRKEFPGDFTLVVFPFLRYSGKSPEVTASEIGDFLVNNFYGITGFNVIKGFLNISLEKKLWLERFIQISEDPGFGIIPLSEESPIVVVEYSSPNTNKPLHLGHIRNNLLGFSLSRVLEANGNRVVMTNIVNDRGIHICKSMLAWKLYGNAETPFDPPQKGDQLVGKYYVRFDTEYKKEIADLVSSGMTEEEAASSSALMEGARELLRKWEAGDSETIALWEMMNNWVYNGFDITYRNLGVRFDRIYYESATYKTGREIVMEALKSGILRKNEDNSVWADLTGEGLDQKLLLRGDGTAVYMTQDLGTAVQRYNDYHFDRHIYVVGNEQNYHFQVLTTLLKKLGYNWADGLHHFSYGMVELPEGKMKSREGTVVDADDLIDGMIETAREMSDELGKLENFSESEREEIFRKIGLGALKYYILKVDPKRNMLFNPSESIDFNGNTGPFIQYTYARIKSVERKASENSITTTSSYPGDLNINDREIDLIRTLNRFDAVVKEAGENLSPALIANYCYDLVKQFNQFYHDYSILGELDEGLRNFRLNLSSTTGRIVERGMGLLGIEMPERM